MTNGPTYTEVVLEFTQMLTASENRQTTHNGEVMTQLARGDEKFKAIYDKMDGEGGMNERIKDNAGDIETNTDNIVKVRNLNTGIALLASTIAGILGVNK
jgi:hypothetical protein